MKITVYTINDCKFSQSEKEYLKSKNVQFEEKNLETNREYLTEMLEVSNNFAGTPVTKIEKDDGSTVVLKGFTQSEFDTALGLSTDATTAPAESAPATETKPVENASMDNSMNSSAATGATTAAVAQAATDSSMSQSPTDTASAGTTDMSTPPMSPTQDMSTPSTPSMDQSTPAPSMDMSQPATPSTDSNSGSMGSSDMSTPSTPSMDQSTPAPSMDMSQPQGEAIPNPASAEAAKTESSSPDNTQAQPDMSNNAQAGGMSGGNTNNAAPQGNTTNDPLNSVLNDLQSKGNNS